MKPIACKYIGLCLDVPMFNIEEPILVPEATSFAPILHPANSTVSENTINRAGRFIPYPVAEIEMLRKLADDRREVLYICSGIKTAEDLLAISRKELDQAATLLNQITTGHEQSDKPLANFNLEERVKHE